MKEFWFWLRGQLGLLTGSDVCRYSRLYRDIHDYPVEKGGDGKPTHFYTYTCHRCGVKFEI